MSDTKVIGLNFSRIYEYERLPLTEPLIDCTDLSGTDCYCDDVAYEEILERLKNDSYEGLHYIDSGNYHYGTLFFLDKIPEDIDYELILFDNHPDSQEPAFGDITSCGGWVLRAWKKYPNLKAVTMIGVDPELLEEEGHLPGAMEVDLDLGSRRFYRDHREADFEHLPVYLSIDKDVLQEGEAFCNWSQGRMTSDQLIQSIKKYQESRRILGIDVCGEESFSEMSEGTSKNEEVNQRIYSEIFARLTT